MKRTSELLRDIAASHEDGEISIGECVARMGDRSFALAILVFSLPNSLPVPGIPGFSTITGIPILLIALQIIAGRQSIWLPHRVAEKKFQQAFLAKIVRKALPVVLWLERWLKPRLSFVCEGWGERLIGLLIFVMAAILALPIVGGNFLPGFAISLLALSLLEKDGLFASFAISFCVGSIYFMYKIVAYVLGAAMHWLFSLF